MAHGSVRCPYYLTYNIATCSGRWRIVCSSEPNDESDL